VICIVERKSSLLTVGQLMTHILGLLLVVIALGAQEVREEKHLDDDKEDEQFDADNQPQRLTHSHAAESIIVQMKRA